MSFKEQQHFLQRAEEDRPRTVEKIYYPKGEVVAQASPQDFQGWRLDPVGETVPYLSRTWNTSGSFILDFGEHLVGHFRFSILAEGVVDAPVRLRLIFGEMPSEVCEPLEPYQGGLSRGWLQDETFNVLPPESRTIARRMAFRYVKVEIIGPSKSYHVRFADISCSATSSAPWDRLIPYRGPEELREMDAIAVRTLANCMQEVFEDGPKRDRRLWLGDLRLQALADEVTFKNDSLVRRCLYLLAAFAPEDKLMPSDAYTYPKFGTGACTILDYALLFAPTLLEYAKRSGDWETARELWPTAKRQIDLIVKRHVDARGLFVDPKTYWVFVDWRENLHKETAVQGIAIFALGSLSELADHLGRQGEIPDVAETRKKMMAGAVRHLKDPKTGLFISGPDRQLSWASHAWLILGGAIAPGEGRDLLIQLRNRKDVVLPAGPYLYHYIVEAMFKCGLKQEALDLMREYWGGMVKAGASTFWEVYDPENHRLSPYRDHHVNSYCHAWSCTPSYFIRKYFSSNAAGE
jgi:alpha-L-rhamnosidase